LILGFYTIGAAQSSDLIQGKWVLEKHWIKESTKRKEIAKNDFINKMTFEFKSMVSLSESSLEPLKMVLISKFKTLTLSASSDSFTFQVRELSQKRLILKLGLGEFLMERFNSNLSSICSVNSHLYYKLF
jgi:hypothetical protein